ncbi:hypothetical protein CCACVL1_15211 [Corchorus capsularis]|uniref:RNase H type-1 domain-containing protein n=1 Tax=Corchorus capsularis TaxID=210143 RepID=A0A1R3I3J8_COCAP|nr:hypothetical protein CCACVL1_15211 [Corchorus capsularis]
MTEQRKQAEKGDSDIYSASSFQVGKVPKKNNVTRISNIRPPVGIIIREPGACSNPITGNVMDSNGRSGRINLDQNMLPQMDRGYKVFDFSMFSGEDGQSTSEHIGRFSIRCGDVSDYVKLRMYGAAFNWFINLPANSILNWHQMKTAFHAQVYRTEPEVTMADLAKVKQKPNEKVEDFIARYRQVKSRLLVQLPEREHVSIARSGLVLELRKKFEDREFVDLIQMASCVSKYERLLEKDDGKRRVPRATYYAQNEVNVGLGYYFDDDVDINVAELNLSKPNFCAERVNSSQNREKKSFKPPPDTSIDRWFSKLYVDLQEMGLPPYRDIPRTQRRKWQKFNQEAKQNYMKMAKDWGLTDRTYVVPTEELDDDEMQVNAVQMEEKAGGELEDKNPRFDRKKEESKGESSHQGINGTEEVSTESMASLTLEDEEDWIPKANVVEEESNSISVESSQPNEIMVESKQWKVSFVKPPTELTQHLRPLYIFAVMNGLPVKKILVDNGAAVNVIPHRMLSKLNAESIELLPSDIVISGFDGGATRAKGRDWIHSNSAIPSSLHQIVLLWKENGEIEIVQADNRPFLVSAGCLDPQLYSNTYVKETLKKVQAYSIEKSLFHEEDAKSVCIVDSQVSLSEEREKEEVHVTVQDPLTEVNLGADSGESKPTFVSSFLLESQQKQLVSLLIKFKDCFAWDYIDMPGLSRDLVEHRLPIKANVKPHKQPARRVALDIYPKIKEKIERLFKTGFIRPARHVECLSNIVPVMKKNGKLRVCIDFRNLNNASTKDEYHMPIADMLIDSAAGNGVMSFLDGYSGYNLIFIVEEDISKTAFRCPEKSLGALLAQDSREWKEQVVYYLSRNMIDAELGYSAIEKLCLTVYFACMKLRHYLLNERVDLICKYDVVKYMLNKPVMRNRIGKWVLALSEFSLNFVPQKAVKGQALADFLADHPCQMTLPELDEVMLVEPVPWILEFDGSKTELGAGAGIVLTSPSGKVFKFSFSLLFKCSNNQAEYEALIAGLELLIELKTYSVLIKGDSQLVIGQLSVNGELFKRGADGVLLKCIDDKESMRVMGEVHEGMCGSHQVGRKMMWLVKRTSKRTATGTTPYALSYGHDDVLPVEINVRSLRVQIQNELLLDEYVELMHLEKMDLDETRIQAFEMLPLGVNDPKYGKWSRSWEGPFQVNKVKSIRIRMLWRTSNFQDEVCHRDNILVQGSVASANRVAVGHSEIQKERVDSAIGSSENHGERVESTHGVAAGNLKFKEEWLNQLMELVLNVEIQRGRAEPTNGVGAGNPEIQRIRAKSNNGVAPRNFEIQSGVESVDGVAVNVNSNNTSSTTQKQRMGRGLNRGRPTPSDPSEKIKLHVLDATYV